MILITTIVIVVGFTVITLMVIVTGISNTEGMSLEKPTDPLMSKPQAPRGAVDLVKGSLSRLGLCLAFPVWVSAWGSSLEADHVAAWTMLPGFVLFSRC